MEEVEFNAGDYLLLYSDALIETQNASGEMLPIEYWLESFQTSLKGERGSCKHSFEVLLSDFNKKCGKNLNDDLTLTAYFYGG